MWRKNHKIHPQMVEVSSQVRSINPLDAGSLVGPDRESRVQAPQPGMAGSLIGDLLKVVLLLDRLAAPSIVLEPA
jgi:hypothetical protein